MAATLLKRSAAIWIPPRSVGERALAAEPSLVVMLPDAGGARWARTSLEALPPMKSAVAVFDARDVALIPVKLPPLSGTKLARAIPNLVEDALLQDAQGCAYALGPRLPDDRRLVAVIDRGWLEFVVAALVRRQVRVTAAWPAQLVLPLAEGGCSVACVHDGLAVRTGEHEGFGWSASADPEARAEALVSAIQAAGPGPGGAGAVSVYADDPGWRASVERAGERLGAKLTLSGLPLPAPAPVDLLSARQSGAGRRWAASVDWRAWRLPAAIAAAGALVALVGLNLQWGQLARERDALRVRMESTFRQSFPGAQVVVDPLLQMQRQVSELRLRAGHSGADDFLPMLARFSQALGPRANDALATLEYRGGVLRARFRPGYVDGAAARDGLRAALAQQGLTLKFEGEGETLAVIGVRS